MGDPVSAARLAAAVARDYPFPGPTLTVGVDAHLDEATPDAPGLGDLVAGHARFFEAIEASPGARVHRIGKGVRALDPSAPETGDALEITLCAFDQTYAATFLVLADPTDSVCLALLGERVDGAILAAAASPDDPDLVGLYEALRAAGTPDVIVALSAPDAAASHEREIADEKAA